MVDSMNKTRSIIRLILFYILFGIIVLYSSFVFMLEKSTIFGYLTGDKYTSFKEFSLSLCIVLYLSGLIIIQIVMRFKYPKWFMGIDKK